MKITIIGLGWLGLPLAEHLINNEHVVSGTTRSQHKADSMNQKIGKVLFDLYHSTPDDLPAVWFKHACVVINIPPGRNLFDTPSFVERIKKLIDYVFENNAKKLIFISTTSVFGALNCEINHQTVPAPVSPSGHAHFEIETYLLCKYKALSNVLRPAGLVGPDRHPIYSLVKRKNILNGKNPVNLVHQLDVITAIERLCESSIFGEAFNLCSLEHPSRQEYYTWCARRLALNEPDFAMDTRSGEQSLGKWINAASTFEKLEFRPRFPSPFDFI